MADDTALADDAAQPAPRARGRALRVAKWVGVGLAVIVLLLGLIVVGLNTDPGRRFITSQINSLEMASGLDIDIQSIEGSIYGEMRLRGVTLADSKGVFFRAPLVEVDWRPFAYLRNHIDLRSAVIPQARLHRLPELRAAEDPNAPTLPDIDIDIGRFAIGRLAVDPAVSGQRHLLGLKGGAKIADGRAQVALDAAAIAAPGLAGGDRLALRLDAAPDRDRFDVSMRLQAPRGGFVAGMAGLDQPLVAAVGGRGSWSQWRGRAQATLGGRPFANLAVSGRNGTFTVDGPLAPGLLMDGPVRRLAAPNVQVNLVTTLSDRRADTRLRLRSAALAIAADGLVDLGRSRFENFRVAARLLQPGAIAPDLRGRDVRLALVLNGGFDTPRAAYNLQAAALGFGETTVLGLNARGAARIDTDRMIVPVSARAARITGLNAAVGGLVTNVSIDGSFAIAYPQVLSDNLRIRSDRINATAVVVADLAKGEYRAALQGRINNYLVEGVGLLDINTNMDVVTTAAGFGLNGRVAIQTRRIDNPSARDFLGGNAVASANVSMSPAGVITLSNVRLNAPQLRITSGSGTYSLDGRINIRAAGVSTAYGPIAVVVTGTTAAPNVRIRAESPGFGIGLRGVEADIRATGRGWRITARGQSQYGPFTADVTVLTGRALAVDVHRLVFAGITFQGRVVQTAAGPFAGTLTASGNGLEGVIRLAAAGRYQRAQISARANGATIPGEPPILIQRGIIEATAILYPDAPSIVGDVQLAGLRRSDLLVERARARINYRGGTGQVQVFAEGRSGVPYRVAINAALTPTQIRAAAQGIVNRIPFRLAQPADIRKIGTDWQLAPVTVVLPQGNVRLAGRYGNGLVVQSRFDNLDLSIFNAFSPRLGLGGRASGSLDFAQPNGAAFPRADLRLTIANFTRAGVATLSTPVNIAVAGQLRPEGGLLNAAIRRRGALIGRAQVRLQPVGGGAGWMERLLAAPLAGGIRYNGPAEVIWSLTGIADQQLSGPIGIAADFSGRVQAPQFAGVIRANQLTFVDETYGTRITNLALQGRFTSSTLEITQLSGRAGRGTVTGRGTVGLASAAGYPIDIRLTVDRAQLANSDNIEATVSGDLAITNSRASGALVSGDLRLPGVRYQIIRQGAAEVAELEGVRRKGEPLRSPAEIAQQSAGAPSIWKLDLRVRADNEVFVSGMGLESEWRTDLRVRGTSATPEVTGSAEVIRGTYSFAGRRFELEQGEVTFTGSRPINPRIRMAASTTVEGVTATINVSGSAYEPQIRFTSSPALPQDEILARLFFGGSVSEISAAQALQLAASLNSLRGGGGGLNPLGKLRQATGLNRLRVLGADKNTGRGTALAAGLYVSNDIYLEVITDARGFTATQIEIALSKALSILSQAGSAGGTSVNLRYRKEY